MRKITTRTRSPSSHVTSGEREKHIRRRCLLLLLEGGNSRVANERATVEASVESPAESPPMDQREGQVSRSVVKPKKEETKTALTRYDDGQTRGPADRGRALPVAEEPRDPRTALVGSGRMSLLATLRNERASSGRGHARHFPRWAHVGERRAGIPVSFAGEGADPCCGESPQAGAWYLPRCSVDRERVRSARLSLHPGDRLAHGEGGRSRSRQSLRRIPDRFAVSSSRRYFDSLGAVLLARRR